MIPLSLILPFASTDKTRYILTLPRIVGDKLVATDGRVLVEVPVSEMEPFEVEVLEGFYPNYLAVMTPFDSPLGDPIVMPEMPEKPTEKTVCDECYGTGIVTCKYDHDHECPECDGEGAWLDLSKWDVETPSFRLGCQFVEKVLALPNLQWFEPSKENICGAPVRFTFGENGRGLIQQMRRKEA